MSNSCFKPQCVIYALLMPREVPRTHHNPFRRMVTFSYKSVSTSTQILNSGGGGEQFVFQTAMCHICVADAAWKYHAHTTTPFAGWSPFPRVGAHIHSDIGSNFEFDSESDFVHGGCPCSNTLLAFWLIHGRVVRRSLECTAQFSSHQ